MNRVRAEVYPGDHIRIVWGDTERVVRVLDVMEPDDDEQWEPTTLSVVEACSTPALHDMGVCIQCDPT